MNSGKVDAKIVPYIDGCVNILLGSLIGVGGYKLKNLSEPILEKGIEKLIKKGEPANWAKEFSKLLNSACNIAMGTGAGSCGLGLLRIVEELVDDKEKEQKPQLVIRPNLYKY
jgi:hypothetical protein